MNAIKFKKVAEAEGGHSAKYEVRSGRKVHARMCKLSTGGYAGRWEVRDVTTNDVETFSGGGAFAKAKKWAVAQYAKEPAS